MAFQRNQTNEKNVNIVGEGRDEWGERYFKLSVPGLTVDIAPFSVERIIKDPAMLFGALTRAGGNVFTATARSQVLTQLQEFKPEPETFKVVTKLGWSGTRAFVRPDEIIGTSKVPLDRVPRTTSILTCWPNIGYEVP
jgi:hypothetical protein